MAANVTTCDATCRTENDSYIAKLMIYGIQGLIMFTGNALLLAPIAYHHALRKQKEYILVGSLALADCLNGIAYTYAALWRIPLLQAGGGRAPATRWSCRWVISNALWSTVEVPTGVMMTLLTMDRLLLVLFPLWYLKQGKRYAIRLAIAAWLLCLTFGMSGAVHVWLIEPDTELYAVPELCIFSHSQQPTHFFIHKQILTISALFSVVMFIVVAILYKRRAIDQHMTDSQRRRHRKFTISMAISALFTLVLFVIPIGMDSSLPLSVSSRATVYILSNTNCIMNLFIYTVRHREIRQGLMAVFRWKKLPADVATWAKPAAATAKFRATVAKQQPV